jgi:hypothetical protein
LLEVKNLTPTKGGGAGGDLWDGEDFP